MCQNQHSKPAVLIFVTDLPLRAASKRLKAALPMSFVYKVHELRSRLKRSTRLRRVLINLRDVRFYPGRDRIAASQRNVAMGQTQT
jgi:hypothetical protein